MKITIALIKYVSFGAGFLAVVILSSIAAGAQTKRSATAQKEFSVPCAQALQIGLDAVEELYAKDMKRRAKANTDSGTEFTATDAATKNYLACRRADFAANLKKLPADDQKQINRQAANAKKLARMRVNLLYATSFDEQNDEPINYAITQKAIALIEDFKSNLLYVYRQTRDSNALGNTDDAMRDEKEIGALLARIEEVARETDQAAEFPLFKTAVEQTLADVKDDIGTERVVTTAFLVRLLKMNLADEN